MNEVLEFLMRPYGIMRRTVRLEKGWYKDAAGAMLGKRKDNGEVAALIPNDMGGYRYYDHAAGKFIPVTRKNEDLFEKEAYAFYKPFPLKKMSTGDLMRYILEQLTFGDLLMLACAMVFATGMGLLLPYLSNILFARVLPSGSGRMLLGIGIYMVCAVISSRVIEIIKNLFIARINTKMNIAIEAAAMMRVLSLPVSFFKNYSAGELSSRVGYISILAGQLVSTVLTTSLSAVFSLAYVTQIFRYAPALVAPSIAIIVVTAGLSVVTALMQFSTDSFWRWLSSSFSERA